MDLIGAKEEAPGCGGKCCQKHLFPWSEEEQYARRDDRGECEAECCTTQQCRIVAVQFMQSRGVDCAPDVGDLVFEKATCKWKDTMDGLRDLNEIGIVPGFFGQP